MTKYSILICLVINSSGLLAQSSHGKNILLKKDTLVLHPADDIKAADLSKMILGSIEQGKIKAVDYFSNQYIPAKKFYTWNVPADTIMVSDAQGRTSYKIVQKARTPDRISLIKIIQNLYFISQTGKISSVNDVILYEEIRSSSGDFIGLKPFCRIHY